MSGPDGTQMSVAAGHQPAPPRAGQITRDRLEAESAHGRPCTVAEGSTGSGVSAATLTLSDDSRVDTTVGNSLFLAWWPGGATVTSAIVTSASGTTTQAITSPTRDTGGASSISRSATNPGGGPPTAAQRAELRRFCAHLRAAHIHLPNGPPIPPCAMLGSSPSRPGGAKWISPGGLARDPCRRSATRLAAKPARHPGGHRHDRSCPGDRHRTALRRVRTARISLDHVTAAVLRARRDLAGNVGESALPEMVEHLARYRLTRHPNPAGRPRLGRAGGRRATETGDLVRGVDEGGDAVSGPRSGCDDTDVVDAKIGERRAARDE